MWEHHNIAQRQDRIGLAELLVHALSLISKKALAPILATPALSVTGLYLGLPALDSTKSCSLLAIVCLPLTKGASQETPLIHAKYSVICAFRSWFYSFGAKTGFSTEKSIDLKILCLRDSQTATPVRCGCGGRYAAWRYRGSMSPWARCS
jgi:hypothetical protein